MCRTIPSTGPERIHGSVIHISFAASATSPRDAIKTEVSSTPVVDGPVKRLRWRRPRGKRSFPSFLADMGSQTKLKTSVNSPAVVNLSDGLGDSGIVSKKV